jgi:hypothetical protein
MKNQGVIFITITLLSLKIPANAAVWYVHPDSTLNSIQAALNFCSASDTVLVGPGTYYENIQWPNTFGIDLVSEYGIVATIIDGSLISNVIRIDSCSEVDSNTAIRGFTITHGDSAEGGGIFCGDCDGPLIRDNFIIANTTMGIWCIWSSPKIIQNYISQNEVGIGCYANFSSLISNNWVTQNNVGVSLDLSSPVMINNAIIANSSYGLALTYSGPLITGCGISNNLADGVYGFHASPIMDSCIISNNGGHGLFFTIAYYEYPEIHYSNITNNAGYGIMNNTSFVVDAEYNWWGDPAGPYHPTFNPGGLGDTVSDNVNFDPWLYYPLGIEEQPVTKSIASGRNLAATIFRGPLQLPEGKQYKVFDITGRVVEPDKIQPGIYFIEVDGIVTQKVVKVR